MILIQVDEGKIENLRTLIEWALCRQEHVGHHVLLTASKDEIYIRQKLDIGAQQGLCAIFWIFGYLLELIDGNIDSFLRLFQILEDMFKGILALAWNLPDNRLANNWMNWLRFLVALMSR